MPLTSVYQNAHKDRIIYVNLLFKQNFAKESIIMRLSLTCALIGCKSERQYRTSAARDRLYTGFYGDIESVVRMAVFRGAGTFLCSGSGLVNLMLGEAVVRVRKDFPALKLVFMIPYKGQEKILEYTYAPMVFAAAGKGRQCADTRG